MRLTLKRPAPSAPVSQPVAVDALVAQIGGTDEQLLQRFVEVGRDFMDRPMISFEDAKVAYFEWQQKQNVDALLPIRYEAYCDDRKRRLHELQEVACAKARASFEGRHDGGQHLQAYLQCQWDVERRVIATFEKDEPEMTISQFREWEKQA